MYSEALAGALVFDIETMGLQLPGGSVELSEAFIGKHLGRIVGEIPRIACPICQKGLIVEIDRDVVLSEPIHFGGGIVNKQRERIPVGRKIRLECSDCHKTFLGQHIFIQVA